jgi:mannose-6-phosphate isomerase
MMRDLHNDLALDALDFNIRDNYKTHYKAKPNETAKMVESPYFTTNIIQLSQGLKKDYSELDSFVIFIATEGRFNLIFNNESYFVNFGEVIMVPASINSVELYPLEECKILEVYLT